MKNISRQRWVSLPLFTIGIFVFVISAGCSIRSNVEPLSDIQESQDSSITYDIDPSDFVNGDELVAGIQKSQLTEAEVDGLILMREEEKLARDVYTRLGEIWGMNIFFNIAQSEQTHTDAVKTLLERYEIDDPVVGDDLGVFISNDLSTLYGQLIDQGEKSLLDALIVGATVEDLDIYDLNKLLDNTNNAEIRLVYENLRRGSRNHLRAFFKQINRQGGSYSPQYISKLEFNDIISSQQEKGNGRYRN